MGSGSRLLLVALIAAAAPACGKVADPLPPIVAVPRPVTDLTVVQSGYDLVFRWTNPEFHIDETPASGLTRAVVRSAGGIVLDVPVSGPGETQTAALRDVRDRVGSTALFSIAIAGRGELLSDPSATVALEILEVPGRPNGLRAGVDQGVVAIEWNSPEEAANLAVAFRVYRNDSALAEVQGATLLEDRMYLEGETYAYRVVGLREGPMGRIEGLASEPLEVVAADRTAPLAPGLPALRPVDGGVLVTWPPSSETDLAGYRLWIRDGDGETFMPLGGGLLFATLYTDVAGAPSRSYAVSAVDRSGNESSLSEIAP